VSVEGVLGVTMSNDVIGEGSFGQYLPAKLSTERQEQVNDREM
jgi:hypothetical protein